jgi:hypothetical protein
VKIVEVASASETGMGESADVEYRISFTQLNDFSKQVHFRAQVYYHGSVQRRAMSMGIAVHLSGSVRMAQLHESADVVVSMAFDEL